MIKFPYYSGDIRISTVLGHVTLDDFIKSHQKPSPKTSKTLSAIKVAVEKGDKEEKRKLKSKLYSFTPSIMIPFGRRRIYDNIASFTGLMQLDFDGIETEQKAKDLKEHIFHEHEEIVCAYLSPSKRGVKALMRIVIANDVDHYKALHKSVSEEFEEYDGFDNSTKNAILPLFISEDKDIMFRKYSRAEIWYKTSYKKKFYINVSETPTKTGLHDKDYNKVVRLVTSAINEITDEGHPQVVKASLILGSRVGAGYITESEARYLIENLIKTNDYLSKGISGYVKTAMWGISNGISNPKYYK